MCCSDRLYKWHLCCHMLDRVTVLSFFLHSYTYLYLPSHTPIHTPSHLIHTLMQYSTGRDRAECIHSLPHLLANISGGETKASWSLSKVRTLWTHKIQSSFNMLVATVDNVFVSNRKLYFFQFLFPLLLLLSLTSPSSLPPLSVPCPPLSLLSFSPVLSSTNSLLPFPSFTLLTQEARLLLQGVPKCEGLENTGVEASPWPCAGEQHPLFPAQTMIRWWPKR